MYLILVVEKPFISGNSCCRSELNCFIKPSPHCDCSCLETISFPSSQYRLINSDFPEDSMDFSLTNNLGDPDAYWKSTYLAFPEKSEIMLSDKPKLQLIEDLIAIILNENGRNYQRTDSKS